MYEGLVSPYKTAVVRELAEKALLAARDAAVRELAFDWREAIGCGRRGGGRLRGELVERSDRTEAELVGLVSVALPVSAAEAVVSPVLIFARIRVFP